MATSGPPSDRRRIFHHLRGRYPAKQWRNTLDTYAAPHMGDVPATLADVLDEVDAVVAVDALGADEHGAGLRIRGIAPSDPEKPHQIAAFLAGLSTTNRSCGLPAEQHQWLASIAARQVRKMGMAR